MPYDPATGRTLPYRQRGRHDPFTEVETAQSFLREGVEGFGEQLRPELMRQIGTTLGGLNEIGALRSGAVPVHLAEVGERYGQQVGAFAKQATTSGLSAGLQAREQRFREDEARRRRKGALLRAIGSVLGAGVGFLASGGNPAGAAAGYKAGGALGGSDEAYSGAYG